MNRQDKESLRTRLYRLFFNLYPAVRGTGVWITSISSDWQRVKIRLPLSWRTRNYVGTIFGGSIYGAVDPFYMVMFIQILGKDYIVWDKSASIRFLKPGRETLYAEFRIEDEELNEIRTLLEVEEKVDRSYQVELRTKEGVLCAQVEKVLHFRKKES